MAELPPTQLFHTSMRAWHEHWQFQVMLGGKDDQHECCRGSRSSLHYDPYHNLLCLVQGVKTVRLMSPDVTDQLYPLSVLGESPNHSHVNFAHPDDQQHPLYRQALQSQQEFVLQVAASLSSTCSHALHDQHTQLVELTLTSLSSPQ